MPAPRTAPKLRVELPLGRALAIYNALLHWQLTNFSNKEVDAAIITLESELRDMGIIP